jgi:hypothetical protein
MRTLRPILISRIRPAFTRSNRVRSQMPRAVAASRRLYASGSTLVDSCMLALLRSFRWLKGSVRHLVQFRHQCRHVGPDDRSSFTYSPSLTNSYFRRLQHSCACARNLVSGLGSGNSDLPQAYPPGRFAPSSEVGSKLSGSCSLLSMSALTDSGWMVAGSCAMFFYFPIVLYFLTRALLLRPIT